MSEPDFDLDDVEYFKRTNKSFKKLMSFDEEERELMRETQAIIDRKEAKQSYLK